jgi:hypothetical protein
MSAVFVHVEDVFSGKQSARAIAPGVTLAELSKVGRGAFVVVVNGKPALRKDWRQPVLSGQVVHLAELPGGGSSRDIARLLATLALVYFLGPAGLGLKGFAYTAAFIAGNIAINALLPPVPPGGRGPEASPTYSVQFQGNTARLKQSIPVRHGYGRWYPDHAAQPYYTYEDNEQYLHLLLLIGEGEHDFTLPGHGHFIADTPLDDFEDIDYNVIEPGGLGALALVDSAMITAVEVAGQDMLTDEVVGPFPVCGRGQKVTSIHIDMAWPKGLYLSKSTEWTVEAQMVDEYGNPLAAWLALGAETKSGNTTTVLRESYDYAVTPARYRVRVTRTDTRVDNTSTAHDQNWIGLRGVLQNGEVINTTSTFLEVKARASKQLSGQSSARFNSIGTRKLPTYDGSTWSAPVATRELVWAYCDMHRNTVYGMGWPDSRLNLDELMALHAVYVERGDKFDFSFDSRRNFLEASRIVARAGRAAPIHLLGIATMVRDGAQSLPMAVFNMTNIAPGSFSVQYRTPTSGSPDGLELTYWDSVAQEERTFDALGLPLPGATAAPERPQELMLAGVTERVQADRERHFTAADYAFRPLTINFSVNAEGLRCRPMSLIALHHADLPGTQGGRTTAWDLDARVLTLSEPPEFALGEPNYIGFTDASGDFHGPWECQPGPTAYDVVLSVAPDATPLTEGLDEQRSKYVFGKLFLALVKGVRDAGEKRVQILCVNHDPRVHSADEQVVDLPYSGTPDYEEPAPSGATISISDHPISGSDGVTTGLARYIVRADGTTGYESNSMGGGSYAGEWISNPAEVLAFDIRFDVLPGGSITEGSTGVWLQGGTDRAVGLTESTPDAFAFGQVQVRIRDRATLTVKDTAVITLSAQGPSGGGGP